MRIERGINRALTVGEGRCPERILTIFVNRYSCLEGYGATVVYCDPTPAARASTCESISQRENYEIIPPYDHYDVIAGQGTIAIEFLAQVGLLNGNRPESEQST